MLNSFVVLCQQVTMFSNIKLNLLLLTLTLANSVMSKVETESYKEDTRKCCLLNEVLVEEGPGLRECRTVDNVGHPNLNHMVWRNKKLSNYAMYHRTPECEDAEELVALYHHGEYQGRTENLDLTANGSLSVSINGREKIEFSTDKYCIDKLLMSHEFSHILDGDVANFAYVCMTTEASVSQIVSTVVYPIGVAVSMSCLTLTFLLYSLLPQLRDLTGKFILGICTFLTANYALRLIDVEMFGVENVSLEELALEFIQHSCNVGKFSGASDIRQTEPSLLPLRSLAVSQLDGSPGVEGDQVQVSVHQGDGQPEVLLLLNLRLAGHGHHHRHRSLRSLPAGRR